MKPIKTVGTADTAPKNKNTKLAKDTLEIIKNKQYVSRNGEVVDLSSSIDFAIKNTVLYNNQLPDVGYAKVTPVIEVVNETTSQAAVRLQGLGKTHVVALNFAAARNPGGGFLAGANAQEEDLCRDSALYACIKSKPIFYNENILSEDTLYTDNVIYSPKVPFFRDEYSLLLEKPYELSIISAPAPNVRALEVPKDNDFDDDIEHVLYATIMHRAKKVLKIAHLHGHTNIVLGAWGCGAFGNDPGRVSAAFHEALRRVPVFDHVTFAVYDTRTPPHLYETFKEIFDLKV